MATKAKAPWMASLERFNNCAFAHLRTIREGAFQPPSLLISWYNNLGRRKLMHSLKSNTAKCFWIALGLFGFSILPGGEVNGELAIIGLVFLSVPVLYLISPKVHWVGLDVLLRHVDGISINHIVVFIPLIGFAIGILKAGYFWPGIGIVVVAYAIYGGSIGTHFGTDVVRPVCDKLNIFQPSPKIPKDL